MTLTQDIALLLPVTALLPLTAILLVAQANPYQTLVLRGILGAVCALIYALLGAADVALTEALVGTLLSTTLYAVALRSSMVLRVAVVAEPPSQPLHEQLQEQLRSWLDPLSLRLELLSPTDPDLHAVLEPSGRSGSYCLRLHHAPLMERLAALPGAVRWREAGHGLELQPAAQPSQGAAP
ncbi:MAG: hydrogenase subunit MbhD domain-containing protein [Synechococcus sp.]|nr:hydrogenase subunit MbhD domain-containing protein [Synechococcus sp.]